MTQARLDVHFELGLSDLAQAFDIVLCDVWGVVHNGVRHDPGAVAALQAFRRGGGTVVLVTNAPAPANQVRRRLDALQVPHDAYDAVATSGDVTVATIVAAGCPPLFGIGPKQETALYLEAARLGPREPPRVAIDDAELAVCIGLDETGPAPEDYDGTLRRLRARGLRLICANPDIVVEMGDRLEFCAGAIAERYAGIGGRVDHAGKPYAAIYQMALWLAERSSGAQVRPGRVLAIGDAVRTDLTGARNQGYASLFITTGIHRQALHRADTGAIDPTALDTLLRKSAVTPLAALPRLSWNASPLDAR